MPALPKVPLVRVAVDDLTARMTEYVVLHVLMHHRQELYLRETPNARKTLGRRNRNGRPARSSVGIHGTGHAGRRRGANCCSSGMGFRVAGWSRNRQDQVDGIECFHGRRSTRQRFCSRTNILVCLLPLTSDTRHILNRGLVCKTQPVTAVR